MAILPRAAIAAVPAPALTAPAASPAAWSGLSAKVTSTATLPSIPLSRLGVAGRLVDSGIKATLVTVKLGHPAPLTLSAGRPPPGGPLRRINRRSSP
jgi:hypothetical protein